MAETVVQIRVQGTPEVLAAFRQIGETAQATGSQLATAGESSATLGDRLKGVGIAARQFSAALSGAAAIASLFARNNKELKRDLEIVSLTLAGAQTAVMAFGAALRLVASNPIILFATAIAGLIVLGVQLVRNWEDVRAAAGRIWGSIARFFAEFWENLARAARGVGQIIVGVLTFDFLRGGQRIAAGWEELQAGLAGLRDMAIELGRGIVTLVKAGWEKLVDLFGQTEKVAKKARTEIHDFAFWIEELAKKVGIEAAQAWVNMAARWEAAAASIFGATRNLLIPALAMLDEKLTAIAEKRAEVILTLEQLHEKLSKLFGVLGDAAEKAAELSENLLKVAESLGILKGQADPALSAVSEIKGGLIGIGEAAKGAVVDIVKSLAAALPENLRGLAGGIFSALQGIGDTVSNFLGDVVQGAKTLAQSVADFFTGIGNSILNLAQKLISSAAVAWILSLFKIPSLGGFSSIFKLLTGIGLAQGGIVPGFKPIMAFQGGGVVTRPTLGLIGEGGGPEAVVPLQGGAIPVHLQGAAGLAERISVYVVFDLKQIPPPDPGEMIRIVQANIMGGGMLARTIRAATK